MKRIISFLLIVICATVHAQTSEKVSYYYQGKKISFSVNYERLVIQLEPGEKVDSRRQLADALEVADTALKLMPGKKMLVVKMPAGATIARVKDRITTLGKQAFIGFVHPVFKSPSGKDMGYGDELVLKLKANTSFVQLEDFVKKANCKIVKKYAFADRIYTVSAGPANGYDAIATANRFFESGLFEYAEPDLTLFDGLTAAPNDPLYSYQWAHSNTGSAIQYNGSPGVDMKMQQAWAIARGAGIKVAVIDQGVDLTHPDLQANLLQGFDAIAGTANLGDGKPLSPANGHGTCCAGIIAAIANNNIGIAGVAPESKIIPINVVDAGGFFTSNVNLASAFDYAWQNGADVISNSWGGGSFSSILDDAIARAVTQGRGGKGTVVLFSSGNNNAAISYPSSNLNVISVGGANMCGQRKSPSSCDGETWWGANYGAGLDVVAPCVKIATTDIAGTGGYNAATGTDGDYLFTFNGTSSAAPDAAGVVALILSANSNLTVAQARVALEGSCTKLAGYVYSSNPDQPNGSWNTETGYGLVDAYSAVQIASTGISCSVQIASPASFCPGTDATLSVMYPTAGTTYQWRKNGSTVGTGNTFSTSTSGSYDVVATQANGCFAFSAPVVLPERCQVLMKNNDPVTTCNAIFFDSGGSDGNYENGEAFTKTFLPPAAGSLVQLTFYSVDLGSGDVLSVYDGANSNILLGSISGKITTPVSFSSSLGALTVTFVSNTSVASQGWFGEIRCSQHAVYRSKKTGAYSDVNTWEVKTASGFVNAAMLPTVADDSIIIRTGHTVTFDQSLELDQLLVETGAVLRLSKNLLLINGPGDDLIVNGTLELVSGGTLVVGDGNARLNGNLTAVVAGIDIAGQIDVAGNTPQTLTIGGNQLPYLSLNITNPAVTIQLASGNATIDQLVMNSSNGKVNINGAFTLLVRVVTLTSGRIVVASNSLLNVKAPTVGTINGGSESSYIEGPVRRNSGAQGADILFFPIGKDGYRPVWLNVTAPAGGYSSYQAQAFNTAPVFSRVLPASLNAVSNVRFVRIINAGVQAPTAASVLLSYGEDEGQPYNPNSLRIAKDDGAGNWVDIGGSGGGNTFGNVLSSVNFSSFGDFVLATTQSSIPGCTSNTTPADGTTISTASTATLGWNTVINATSYDVFIWTGTTLPTLPTSTVFATSYNAIGLTGSTTYNWYVRPKNESGYINTACIDNKTTFTTAQAGIPIPGCTTNIAPADGTITGASSTAALGWNAVINATSYDVFIWAGTTPPTMPTGTVAATSYNAIGLSGSTTYKWYVRPKNESGYMNTACIDNTTTFTTAPGPAIPACVVNTSPANGSVLLSQTSVRLKWSATPGATSYDVYLAAGNAVPTVLWANVTDLTYYLTSLPAGTLYSWYIAPRNGNGANPACGSSNKTTFTTAALTGGGNLAPVSKAGSDVSITLPVSTIQLDGSDSYDPDGRIAQYYWYQIQGPVTASINNFSTFPTVTGLTIAGKYVFGLQVKDNNGVAAYSQMTVTVNPAGTTIPACATNTVPANGSSIGNSTTVTLSWASAVNATLYDVYLWTGATAPSTPTASNIAILSYSATGLTASVLYHWYVVPKNASGAATGCAANATTFTIDGPGALPVCVVNSFPIMNGTLLTQTTVRLVWHPSSNATSYDVYLAAGNAVPTVLLANTTALTYYAINLTPGTVYSWYIAPRNAAGANTACGAVYKSTFTTAVATGGGNLAPVADAGFNSYIQLPTSSVILDGRASYDPDGRIVEYYWYQIQGPVTASISNFSVFPTVTGLTIAGQYVFGLQVKDNNGVTAYATTTVTVNPAVTTVPPCANNLYPVNGSTIGTTTTITLSWGLAVNATSYDVYLWTGTTPPATPTVNVSATAYNATGLTASTLYHWYVVAKNANGAATGCAANATTFTIDGPGVAPACVVNTFPIIGSTLLTQTTARLVWPASSSAISYDVYLAAGNAVPTVLLANTNALNYYAINLTPGTLYSWYIAPRNAAGANTACGASYKFTFTTAAATGGGNLAPVANAGSNAFIPLGTSAVMLDGSASYDPDGRIVEYYWYQLQGPVTASITNFSAFPTFTGLTMLGKYVFGLQVKDNNGVTAYSSAAVTVDPSETTIPTCTSNTMPANGSILTTPTSAILQWGGITNAYSYDVYWWTGTTPPATPTVNVTAKAYNATGLTASALYNWYVVPKNDAGAAIGCINNKTTFTTAAISNTPINGLQGAYYTGTGALSGPVLLTRIDPTVNMLLTYATVLSPAPGLIQDDFFSIRWTGQVKADYTETYTFYTLADDGIRLWVNGVQLVDNWTVQGPTEKSGTINLVAGQKYDIKIEYFEWTGESTAKLSWSSASTAKAVVPQVNLYPPVAGAAIAGSQPRGLHTQTPGGTGISTAFVAAISPNPVKPGSPVKLQIKTDKPGSAVIAIFGSNGRILTSSKINLLRGANTTSIGTSSLAQGLYIIRINGADGPVNLKLLVE